MGKNYRYLFSSACVIASWLLGLLTPPAAEAAPGLLAKQEMQDFPAAVAALSVLEGTVSSLGYCDTNPAPLEGAEVSIETRDWITTTQTTASGTYQFELEMALGMTTTVTATVSALDHAIGFAAGIILEAEETTVQDFDLRWQESCTTAEPASLEVSLEAGQTTTLPIHLSNSGAVNTSFAITEVPGSYTSYEPASSGDTIQGIMIGDGVWSHSDLPAGLTVTPTLARPDNELILTQSLSQSIIAGNSISCNAGGFHTLNSYLRFFDLADFAITYDLAVARVEVGIEKAVGIDGSQPVVLNLYTIGSDLVWNTRRLLSTVNVTVADTALAILNIPIPTLVPAGSILVVEFVTPDGRIDGNSLFIGSNDQGQTGSTYLIAADCGVTLPTPTDNIGFPNMHMVMNIYGDIALTDPGEVAWLKESPISGALPTGSSMDIDILFTPDYTLPVGTYTSTLQIATDDPENNPLLLPVTMHIVDHRLALSAQDDFLIGDSGSVVTYTLTLTNTSQGATDSLDLSVLDAIFPTTLSSSSTPILKPGESFTFQVEVVVGWLSDHHLSDTIRILAQFHEAPFYRESIALTTRIRTNDLFLPMVLK